MATSDPAEFILYSTNLTTNLGPLPAASGHLYDEINEPGSGECRIPLDSTIAASITEGMFILCKYRGSVRGGFFVDNIKRTEADANEGGGRWLSLSGRGMLAYLEEVIIYGDGSGETTREFTAKTKGYILDLLFNEGIDRGAFTKIQWDFSDSADSDAITWTDSEDYKLPVGTTMLDLVRQFAKTGDMEFSASWQGGSYPILIHAYKNGLGTDKSETIYFRIGSNCEEVTSDERGGSEIKNAYLVKFRDGYINVTDSTSITNRRRRETLLNIEAAQSGASASTYASAQLENSKDPRKSIAVRVYDGVSPNVYNDYVMGDTVTLDVFGTETTYRVLGLQLDFNGDASPLIVVELNNLMYDNELRMANDLDWLMKQWNTARDEELTEVRQWVSFGSPNDEVYTLHNYGDYLYIGGAFTAVSSLTASYVARYNITTGVWSAMGAEISEAVRKIIDVSGTIYAVTDNLIYRWDTTAWTLIGTAVIGASGIKSMATDGTDLYICGASITSITGTAIARYIAKWNGSAWSAVGDATGGVNVCNDLTFYGGDLYGAFSTTSVDSVSALKKLVAGTWQTVLATMPGTASAGINKLLVVGDNLIWVQQDGNVVSWDGSASTGTIIGTATAFDSTSGALASYLTDIFFGADFTTIGTATSANNFARYSGGTWSLVGTGTSIAAGDKVGAICVIGSDVYIGGKFTTVDGKPMQNLSLYVTSFESLIDHLSHDNGFDMAAAIHSATASAITDDDEMGFWEDVSQALRKITWANIKATLKTYFDTLYEVINTHIPNNGWVADSNTWTYYNRTQAYTNDPAAGVSIVLNMTNTADFVVGSDVTVSSSAGSENTYVTAVVANTSITVNQLTLDHTTSSPLVTLLDVFTVNADVSATIVKGALVKFTQTTVKYGVVYSSTNSGGTTTIVLIHNTDYALANAAISATYYSYLANPVGWPGWFNFDPAPLGWSVLPSTSLGYKYFPLGKLMYVLISQAGNAGTSNATTTTFSAPTIANATSGVANTTTVDNGAFLTTAARTTISSGARTILARTDMSLGAWTAANGKRIVTLLPMEY